MAESWPQQLWPSHGQPCVAVCVCATRRQASERTLSDFESHGVVPQRAGRPAWAFIHGNWALANGRPDGRWCGVDDELALLHELGCYADFTFSRGARPAVLQPPRS